MFGSILSLYGIDESEYSVKPFGNGLINHTWKIISAGKEFLLQKINQKIFKKPADIMDNCSQMSDYFQNKPPGLSFCSTIDKFQTQELCY